MPGIASADNNGSCPHYCLDNKEIGVVKMRTYFVLALISSMLLISSCAEDSERDMSRNSLKVFSGPGFSVEYPKRVKVKVYSPEPSDFFTFQFIDNGKILLRAYAGNNPGLFDNAGEEKPDKEEKINGLTYKYYSIEDVNGIPKKQVLVNLPLTQKHDWPEYLHFWYFGLSPEDQRTADAIILSVKSEND
jgi:hypothetical protein